MKPFLSVDDFIAGLTGVFSSSVDWTAGLPEMKSTGVEKAVGRVFVLSTIVDNIS